MQYSDTEACMLRCGWWGEPEMCYSYCWVVWWDRNGDQRPAAGSRDPVDYLFRRQADPSSGSSKVQPPSNIDNPPLPPPAFTDDYYPTKLRAEPTNSDAHRRRPIYAQDDHHRM